MKLETHKIYKANKYNPLLLSLAFLVITILLTWWIYFYNLSIVNENSSLDKEINTKELSIIELEKDSKVVVSLLYNSNKSSIRKLENYSNITLFIDHISKLERVYGIIFRWFNYSGWKLGLSAVSSNDSIWNINYKKVSKFIWEYRKNENKEALFDLSLVKNISTKNEGVDNVFNINLDLKKDINSIIGNIKKLEEKERLILENNSWAFNNSWSVLEEK
jgi:hypothetical protein